VVGLWTSHDFPRVTGLMFEKAYAGRSSRTWPRDRPNDLKKMQEGPVRCLSHVATSPGDIKRKRPKT